MADISPNFLFKTIKYGLYAVLISPLFFWTKALYPYLTPKFIFFQIAIEIVFAAWVFLVAKNKNYRPKISWIPASIAVFIAAASISAILGIDYSRSVWGIGARMTGIFALSHFGLWLLVLGTAADNQKSDRGEPGRINMEKYLDFSFYISLAVSLSVFFLPGGFFNNPTFVAPYLIFHFFWGLYRLWSAGSVQKIVFGSGAALSLFSIFYTGIRGAAVGILGGLIFLTAASILTNILKKRTRIAAAVFLAATVLAMAAVWNFRNSDFIKNISFLERLTSADLTTGTTFQTRILAWREALDGYKDNSVFGVGPENFNYLFNAHYNPQFMRYGGGGFGESWFDKPHNGFIQILTENGAVGLAAYILIWLAVAGEIYRLFRRGQEFLALSIASAFVSYFGAIFFSFDSFGSWFGIFLMLGFLISRNSAAENAFNFSDGGKAWQIGKFAVLILAAYLILVNLSILKTNLSDAEALRIFSKNPAESMAQFKSALSGFTPYRSEYQFDLLASVGGALESGLSVPDIENSVNFALEEANKALSAHPNDAAAYTDLLRVYNVLGSLGKDPQVLAQAEFFGKKSLELSPNRQETLFYLSKNAALTGDGQSSVSWALQAVEADPTVKISHWYLGLAYLADGQAAKGREEIKKAIDMGFKTKIKNEKDFIKSLGL